MSDITCARREDLSLTDDTPTALQLWSCGEGEARGVRRTGPAYYWTTTQPDNWRNVLEM